jgi:Fic family protein
VRTFGAERPFDGMPADIGVLLQRVDINKGHERLYQDQVPELLRSLALETRVESIRASNAIEGVDVDRERAELLADEGGARFRNRNEKEFAGYRDAVDSMMRAERIEPPTITEVLALHRTLFKYTDLRGGYLKTDDNVIASYEAGQRKIVFKPPPWQETEGLLDSLCANYRFHSEHESAHPLVLLGAFILDFLAIHPVADGNGRTARLLSTQELLRLGYGVARYASVEQRIFETRNGYYAALEESQKGWRDGEHDIWPWIRYLIQTLGDCYELFEKRVAGAQSPEGMNKQERVRHWVMNLAKAEFRVRDIRMALPGISQQTVNIVLAEMKREGLIRPERTGPGARWRRLTTVP